MPRALVLSNPDIISYQIQQYISAVDFFFGALLWCRSAFIELDLALTDIRFPLRAESISNLPRGEKKGEKRGGGRQTHAGAHARTRARRAEGSIARKIGPLCLVESIGLIPVYRFSFVFRSGVTACRGSRKPSTWRWSRGRGRKRWRI